MLRHSFIASVLCFLVLVVIAGAATPPVVPGDLPIEKEAGDSPTARVQRIEAEEASPSLLVTHPVATKFGAAVMIVIVMAVGILVGISQDDGSSPPGPRGVRYGWKMKAGMIGMGLASLMVVWVAVVTTGPDRKLGFIMAGCFLLFVLAGVMEVFVSRVWWDDQCLYSRSPWTGCKKVPWDQVRSCRYSVMNEWYLVRTQGHGTVRVSIFMLGAKALGQKIEGLSREA